VHRPAPETLPAAWSPPHRRSDDHPATGVQASRSPSGPRRRRAPLPPCRLGAEGRPPPRGGAARLAEGLAQPLDGSVVERAAACRHGETRPEEERPSAERHQNEPLTTTVAASRPPATVAPHPADLLGPRSSCSRMKNTVAPRSDAPAT